MSSSDENDDVIEANLRISRPEESKAGRKKQAERILSVAMPPAAAGALVAARKDEGETKDSIERAANRISPNKGKGDDQGTKG